MAELFVAIYEPTYSLGTYHWALYLYCPLEEEHAVLQVVGEPLTFKYNECDANPADSNHHIQNIRVAEIDDVEHFYHVARNQPIDNETMAFGCQQWVMDVLESLTDEGLLTEYDHAEAKVELEPLIGVPAEDRYEV